MAEIRFKAFLSCSFAPEDKEIVDFFKKIIKSFDIEPEVYDYQDMGKVPDKVKTIQTEWIVHIYNPNLCNLFKEI